MELIPQIKHIAIAGNIGAGKTTLCYQLAKHFGWQVHYESTDDNPYLVYFLHTRYNQIMQILNGDVTVIQDRTIYEDANIFAPNLHDMGLMTGRDFNNYTSLFNSMTAHIQPPDLLIYLKASIPTLVDHIQTRGRDYEGSISIDYLKKLNERYENWISQYKLGRLLVISTDELDFVNKQEDLGTVIQSVRTQLHGLF